MEVGNPHAITRHILIEIAMKPQEVTDALKLNQLKDKIWFVVPSCATTGEGLLEGLVSRLCYICRTHTDF